MPWRSIRLASCLLWLGLLLLPLDASAKGSAPLDRYDDLINAAVKKYWPDYPFPAAWWGQLYQESRLDPNAKSGVGAEGLAQFMLGTWDDNAKAIGYGMLPRTNAKAAIEVGAYYQGSLRNKWSKSPNRSITDRNELGQASYNAGYGNIAKAQTRCGGGVTKPLVWADIVPCMPSVTGAVFTKQTTDYVIRIRQWIKKKELME